VGAGITVIGNVTANSFVKRGEDGTKYLRADGIASSITSGNITSALGYIPQNSAAAITGDYPQGNSLIVDTLTPAFDGINNSTFILRINGVEYDVPGNSGGANLIVSLGGVIQKAGTDYILVSNPASGLQQSRISFTSVPPVGIECFILALGGQGALLSDPSWTTKGEIPVAISGNNALMLPVGANGLVLTADSNSGVGVSWGQVTSVGIADNAVTAAKIATGAVGSDEIAANAVTAAKIADGNITPAKLSAGAPSWTTGGILSVPNDIIAFTSSDHRLKDNITPIPNALDKVLSISGNTFDWNGKSEKEGNDVGVVAQEILEVLPEAVTTRDTGYLAVRYEKLVPLLIEAIKEQNQNIEKLKEEIKNLKNN
jgi:hypothetical protein